MLNIRELQRLRGSKFPSQHSPSPLRNNNPESRPSLHEVGEQTSRQLRGSKINFLHKEQYQTPSKLLHKRAGSSGLSELA